jgi:hypothetical protein
MKLIPLLRTTNFTERIAGISFTFSLNAYFLPTSSKSVQSVKSVVKIFLSKVMETAHFTH